MAVAVAAIKALTGVIKNSTAQTMMGCVQQRAGGSSRLQQPHPLTPGMRAHAGV
jgi:hypothetical protein